VIPATRIYQDLFVAIARPEINIMRNNGIFEFGLNGGLIYYFRPLQTGDFIVLPNLNERSGGTYRLNQLAYSLSGTIRVLLPLRK